MTTGALQSGLALVEEFKMRSISLLIAGGLLASCSMAPAPAPVAMRTVEGQHQFDLILAGHVAQRPVSCIPMTRNNDMKVIDANTLAFQSGSTVYVARTTGCTNLSNTGMYTLLTRNFAGTGLCRGDLAQVVEGSGGFPVGSCLINDITPFVPGRR